MKKIAIIEDTKERVGWIRTNFPDAQIEWFMNVNEFVNFVESSANDISLLIFDHDLGLGPVLNSEDEVAAVEYTEDMSKDADGQTGLDAAKRLSGFSNIPAIVWSINPTGGKEIAETLTSFGYDVGLIPFYRNNYWKLQTVISNCLKS